MSHKIIKDVGFQFEEIELLFKIYKDILTDSSKEPDIITTTAIAGVIHSFYNGIEIIMQIILKNVDNFIPESENWHKAILIQISENNENRKQIISINTKEKLMNYLAFRHFFRHSYSFYYDWNKIKILVDDMKSVYKEFKNEINSFLNNYDKI